MSLPIFRIILANDQVFYLIYTDRSWLAKVEGKKYYLLNINEEQNCIEAIARILSYGAKPEVAKELVSGFEVKTKNKNNKQQKTIPNIDFDKFIKDLDRVERLWNEYLEIEDEDLLVLL